MGNLFIHFLNKLSILKKLKLINENSIKICPINIGQTQSA